MRVIALKEEEEEEGSVNLGSRSRVVVDVELMEVGARKGGICRTWERARQPR